MIDRAILTLPGIKSKLSWLAGLAVLQAFFIIGQSFTLAKVIVGLWQGQPLNNLWLFIGLFISCYVLRLGINRYRTKLLDHYAYQQAKNIREQLLSKLFRLGPSAVQQLGTGHVTTMTLDGITQVEDYIKLILQKVMGIALIPWIILASVFYFDWKSGVVLIFIYPLIILFMVILGYAAQAKAERQYASYQRLSNHFIDSLRGIDTLKLFGKSKSHAEDIYQSSESFRIRTIDTLKVAILSSFALDFLTTLSVAIVAVLLGLRLIEGQGDFLFALTVLILSPEYFLPIREFADNYHATLDGKNAFSNIQQILNFEEIKKETALVEPWQETSQLLIKDLAFSYDEHRLTLQNIHLSLKGYQKVGIIGMSGSGKSTFIQLLNGFLEPQQGDISFKNPQREDQTVHSFNLPSWQEQLIYMPQSPYIFNMSLKDNITFYTPNASQEAIEKAVTLAGLNELITQLPHGLDTLMGEGGRRVSGGQAHRIALARAFLDNKRRILLFDEPTAHLDIETELEIKKAMMPLLEDRLVFFATHRLHWMNEMDYILVFDNGQIVEEGTYESLIERQGAFVSLLKGVSLDESFR
ncbi:thiol reductant ABC exporter subunit CydD [Dolosicoccus paucivorans]|uniref:Thiol reductant ABC exporter subunit CydD n=1 Tax=Dolosicoccus paucivorans TaxID=84521 RepID=A0A2N6SLV0_9LACT|nr:thiol reductant ABC exporter subunit CydD [Dolosicoccus paucivorans]PMB84920.1 thiol reductant ABC exporter subunit CydD [Dolosicoccus paucivorans]PMC58043.1 thiol reductant ABC exporter subunit CydD [Dolosicoccus paucivorans]